MKTNPEIPQATQTFCNSLENPFAQRVKLNHHTILSIRQRLVYSNVVCVSANSHMYNV
jgi:hypothetical protein